MERPGISVIVPTINVSPLARDCLKSVCESVARYPGEKELILCIDRPESDSDPIGAPFREAYPFVRTVHNNEPQGSALVRQLGISEARYDILLFTDDDCEVRTNWAERLSEGVVEHGVVAGVVKALKKKNIIWRLEEHIDSYRVRARDHLGRLKYLSFPCFGIRKNLLPPVPFETSPLNTTEDMDLGARLRLNGVYAHLDEGSAVRHAYPNTFFQSIRRKLKHAKGIAYLHRRIGNTGWSKMEIGSHATIIRRWVGISFDAPFGIFARLLFLVMNMAYCFGLFFYFVRFRNVGEAPAGEIFKVDEVAR